MSTKVAFTINIYSSLLVFSLFLVFLEENFSVILLLLFFILLTSTTSDIFLESVRLNVLSLIYKFKYLYITLFGVLYLNFLLSKPFFIFNQWALFSLIRKSFVSSFGLFINKAIINRLFFVCYSFRFFSFFRQKNMSFWNILFKQPSIVCSHVANFVYLLLISH